MKALSFWRIAPGVPIVQGAAGFSLRGHPSSEKSSQSGRPRELKLAAREFPTVRCAFSLVELLTVIAIVALLIALLMPGIKG
ncbi:MAG: type II secretion system protein, partial [Phycisphaerae bacterium]